MRSLTVDLTLYGRAAFVLGFKNAPKEFALSKDIDVILSIGQADELARTTNFWEAIEEVNREFRDQELYISHLFEEDQVILTFKWSDQRVRINRPWKNLKVHRLGDAITETFPDRRRMEHGVQHRESGGRGAA